MLRLQGRMNVNFPPSLESYEPIFRGRKLVLNYTGGSLCPSKPSRSPSLLGRSSDEDDDEDHRGSKKPTERRKTTIISLLCEKAEPIAKTSISFVAAVDECVYFFEGRSPHACGGVEAEVQALGPGGVFGVIILIAVLVYLVGGWVYQRTVMHQRGWRQLPNYALWAGIWGFLSVSRLREGDTSWAKAN
jgi:cation-dependent mannose-6-phosphate receptor